MVWIKLVVLLKKPSLSASIMAMSETSGKSSPSLSKLMPISISKAPLLKPLMISLRSIASISECMYLTFIPSSK